MLSTGLVVQQSTLPPDEEGDQEYETGSNPRQVLVFISEVSSFQKLKRRGKNQKRINSMAEQTDGMKAESIQTEDSGLNGKRSW